LAGPNTSGDKRERLTAAAVDLAYRQGYRKTTLADIAAEAGVPLGNVYYYFKSKDEIGEAILSCRDGQFAAQRDEFDDLPTPEARLLAYVESTVANASLVALNGCPMGSERGNAERRRAAGDPLAIAL
jgi:TetR/AcrR family transcriptional regulator, transcriptional repressor for nem operon